MQRVYQGAGDPPRMTTHLDASGLGPKIFLTIERTCGHGVRRHLHDWTRRSLTRGERTAGSPLLDRSKLSPNALRLLEALRTKPLQHFDFQWPSPTTRNDSPGISLPEHV
ncbi:hypothetical protein L596_022097 [Steinernema carpocapsae]|uniref:Uncharacterized protein n=1 Tax=Steinernema carpocapsae TaxID=34508 RepID=A0A4V6A046_STECR|nr:hypothetical protein L596_022097 [Steinernema carpocapsae]